MEERKALHNNRKSRGFISSEIILDTAKITPNYFALCPVLASVIIHIQFPKRSKTHLNIIEMQIRPATVTSSIRQVVAEILRRKERN